MCLLNWVIFLSFSTALSMEMIHFHQIGVGAFSKTSGTIAIEISTNALYY